MTIIIILALVLLNGLFAMAEMSLVSSSKYKLENYIKQNKKGAKTALELSQNPTKFLSTVQIGITLIGVLLGVYSGENLTGGVADFLKKIDFLAPHADQIATGFVVVFITYLSIVLGELFPKRLGMSFPEPIISVLAKPMKVLSIVTSPFVWLLTTTNNFLLKLLGIKNHVENAISEDEIKSIVKKSAEGGEIQDIEHNIVERVFELGDRKVNSLYTHKSDIVFFTMDDSWEEIKQKINQEKHSAYPVSKSDNLEDIIGIVLLKDLFTPTKKQEKFDIQVFVTQPIYFNENTFAYKVLETFKKEKTHYGIIVDEYGSVQGIVTMDDVVDALVGDVSEDYQEDYQIVQRSEKSWLVDGQFSIIDFLKYFSLTLAEEDNDEFTTVAGLFIHKTSQIPDIGDKINIGEYELEVVDKDGQRIDKIMVTKG